jgi:hypothetical protein
MDFCYKNRFLLEFILAKAGTGTRSTPAKAWAEMTVYHRKNGIRNDTLDTFACKILKGGKHAFSIAFY